MRKGLIQRPSVFPSKPARGFLVNVFVLLYTRNTANFTERSERRREEQLRIDDA